MYCIYIPAPCEAEYLQRGGSSGVAGSMSENVVKTAGHSDWAMAFGEAQFRDEKGLEAVHVDLGNTYTN